MRENIKFHSASKDTENVRNRFNVTKYVADLKFRSAVTELL